MTGISVPAPPRGRSGDAAPLWAGARCHRPRHRQLPRASPRRGKESVKVSTRFKQQSDGQCGRHNNGRAPLPDSWRPHRSHSETAPGIPLPGADLRLKVIATRGNPAGDFGAKGGFHRHSPTLGGAWTGRPTAPVKARSRLHYRVWGAGERYVQPRPPLCAYERSTPGSCRARRHSVHGD